MTYTPTTWNTGDTITASALNKIEQGIANAGGGGGALIADYIRANNTLSLTVAEIYAAYTAGTPVFIRYIYGDTTTYNGDQKMMPILYLYNYNYAGLIRIAASCAYKINAGGDYNAFTPAIMIFEATSTNDYPEYLKTIYPTNSSVD